jgi:SRSO17 transposase
VLAVPSSQQLERVHGIGAQAQVKRVDDLLARAHRWERRSCGHGTKGERYYDWALFDVALPDEPPAEGHAHTLLIRRSVSEPDEVAYFLVHAPAATSPKDMIAVAGIRWRIEECNEQGKDLIGLDQHQVRTWTAFHHHVTVCMFAHAFTATRRARLHHGVHHGDEAAARGAHQGNEPTSTQPSRRQPVAASGGA